MNLVLLIFDLVPLMFVVYFVFSSMLIHRKSDRNSKNGENGVYLYGGGFFARSALHFCILLYVAAAGVLVALNLFNVIGFEVKPFFFYGLPLPLSVLYFSVMRSVVIKKEGI